LLIAIFLKGGSRTSAFRPKENTLMEFLRVPLTRTMVLNNKLSKSLFTLVWVLLLLLISGCNGNEQNKPYAVKGCLDLSGYDFEEKGLTSLDGEWEFYWQALLKPENFTKPEITAPAYLSVPGSWYHSGEPALYTHDGYATYRLTVKLPGGTKRLGIKVNTIDSAYTLYWGNQSAPHTMGTVAKSKKEYIPKVLPDVYYLESDDDSIQIILQIASFAQRPGGVWKSVLLGTEEAIKKERVLALSKDLFICGAIFLIGLYFTVIFLFRRNDRSPLYFGILALILSAYTGVVNEKAALYLLDFSFETLMKLQYLAFYLAVPVFIIFLNALFYREGRRGVSYPAAIISALFILPVCFFQVEIYRYTFVPYVILTFCAILYSLFVLAGALRNRRDGALLFTCSLIILLLAFINDLVNSHLFYTVGMVSQYAILGFVFLQSVMLTFNLSHAYKIAEELSRELIEKNRQLSQLDKLKNQFLANTTHELKTPLHGIIGIAESLLDSSALDDRHTLSENLSLIISSGKRLTNLVNDLLDFSRFQNCDIKLKYTFVDLKTMVDMVEKHFNHMLTSRKITFRNAISSHFPLIRVDENRIHQVLFNLIGNAVKFTDQGSITVQSRLYTRIRQSWLRLTITDSGIGIPKDKQNSIFDAFVQLDGTDQRAYGGIGLGLSISKMIVELHGGNIEVQSAPEKGSSFSVIIPVEVKTVTYDDKKQPDPDVTGQNFPEPDAAHNVPDYGHEAGFQAGPQQNAKNGPTLLVVDDDPVNIKVLENQLSKKPYNVVTALSGLRALELVGEGLQPDLILLDIMMPRMSGFEVAEAIRKEYPISGLPIIMLTARNSIDDIVKAFQVGANDYIQKPFNSYELTARIDTQLSLLQAVKEREHLVTINEDIAIAKSIQEGTLAGELPTSDYYALNSLYLPMREIGGDFYGFHTVNQNSVGILIADVTGHGIHAALIASMVKVISNSLKALADDPVSFLNNLNEMMISNTQSPLLTAGYLFIDGEKREILFSRAGHEPLLIYSKSEGSFRTIHPSGRLIGFDSEINLELAKCSVVPGDRLFLFTDGLLENRNTEDLDYGINRLKDYIIEHRDNTSQELIDSLKTGLAGRSGTPSHIEDDITLIVVDIF